MSEEGDFTDAQVLFRVALKEAYSELTQSKDPLWEAADEGTRKQFVRLVAENKMVEKGYVPSRWTFHGVCKKCGEVPLEEPVSEPLVGCPWCAVGAKPRVFCFV